MSELSSDKPFLKYDIPNEFNENYDTSVQLLRTLFQEITEQKSVTSLKPLMEHFVHFYESFSSEKQVFDSLNACKSNPDPIYSHSVNVALLSRMLGDLNHMCHDELDALTISALLHDIGKILINQELLNKKDVLTRHEFNIIKKHAKDGYTLIRNLFSDSRIPAVALMHHERCDGSGYPMGTTGININEFSRITAICDVYAGMIAERKYRESLCPFAVIRIFEREGFHKYDTDYTILFLRSMLDTYIGYPVMLNTGEEGTISAVNPDKLSSPVITLHGETINLALDKKREILHILP